MRLKLCCEIDLYPDIFEFRGVDRKTYGAIFLRRLQSEKALIFHPFHDTSNALSVYSGALGGVARTTDYIKKSGDDFGEKIIRAVMQ